MQQSHLQAALRITPLFYDAVLDPPRWSHVLGLLATEFEASVVNLNFANYDFTSPDAAIFSTYFYPEDQEFTRRYLAFEDHVGGDPRLASWSHRLNKPLYRSQLANDTDWYASAIYREVFSTAGFDDNLAVILVDDATMLGLGLAIGRKIGARPFNDADADRLQLYIPHLRQRRAGDDAAVRGERDEHGADRCVR
jgi:hypothetical protein